MNEYWVILSVVGVLWVLYAYVKYEENRNK